MSALNSHNKAPSDGLIGGLSLLAANDRTGVWMTEKVSGAHWLNGGRLYSQTSHRVARLLYHTFIFSFDEHILLFSDDFLTTDAFHIFVEKGTDFKKKKSTGGQQWRELVTEVHRRADKDFCITPCLASQQFGSDGPCFIIPCPKSDLCGFSNSMEIMGKPDLIPTTLT